MVNTKLYVLPQLLYAANKAMIYYSQNCCNVCSQMLVNLMFS